MVDTTDTTRFIAPLGRGDAMNLLWRNASAGVAVALCAATMAFGQNDAVAPIMQTQVRPAPAPAPAYFDDSLPDFSQEEDDQVLAAAWLQQPGRQPSLATNQPTARRAATASRLASTSLASVPNMFGDLGGPTAFFKVRDISAAGGAKVANGSFSLPVAGGGSRIGKISENDSPIPRDRVFASYNHFTSVFQLSETPVIPAGPPVTRQEPIDRYTIGAEKTFFNGWTSIEVRMPFIGMPDTQLSSVGVSSGNFGNLTAVFKTLLYMDGATAVGTGVAVEAPTGSDLITRLGSTNLRFQNQATHLLPYIGFVWSPGDPRWGWGNGLFFSGYAQIDINTSSNPLIAQSVGGGPATTLGQLTDQNLGFLDLAAGYWMYRNPYAERLTGVAAITELHYTTTLQNADQLSGTVNGTSFALNSTNNQFGVLNGTIGVQFLMFDASALRVAGVFPLGDESHRLFDSEVQVQFNRRF
jgi:hypothetical protein